MKSNEDQRIVYMYVYIYIYIYIYIYCVEGAGHRVRIKTTYPHHRCGKSPLISNANHVIVSNILFPSAKLICHENSFEELSKCNETLFCSKLTGGSEVCSNGPLTRYRLRMRRECPERFPRHRGLAVPAYITTRAWQLSDKEPKGFL